MAKYKMQQNGSTFGAVSKKKYKYVINQVVTEEKDGDLKHVPGKEKVSGNAKSGEGDYQTANMQAGKKKA